MRQAMGWRRGLSCLFPRISHFIDVLQGLDIYRPNKSIHIVVRSIPRIIRIGRITVIGVVNHHRPRLTALLQIAKKGLYRLKGKAFHLEEPAVYSKAVPAIGNETANTMSRSKLRRIILEPSRSKGHKMTASLKFIKAVLCIRRNHFSNAYPQGLIDIKEEVFFMHRSKRLLPASIKANPCYYNIK